MQNSETFIHCLDVEVRIEAHEQALRDAKEALSFVPIAFSTVSVGNVTG